MQKLLTIYLDTYAYMGGKWIATYGERHGSVEEHLQDYLQGGWRIVSVTGMGGASEAANARGWFAVVLEHDHAKG